MIKKKMLNKPNTILLTAPLGAVAVITAVPKLLEAPIPDDDKENVEHA
jgi:hypothetical protein